MGAMVSPDHRRRRQRRVPRARRAPVAGPPGDRPPLGPTVWRPPRRDRRRGRPAARPTTPGAERLMAAVGLVVHHDRAEAANGRGRPGRLARRHGPRGAAARDRRRAGRPGRPRRRPRRPRPRASTSRSASAATAPCCAPSTSWPRTTSRCIGVNVGQLGYLTEVEPDRAARRARAVLRRRLRRSRSGCCWRSTSTAVGRRRRRRRGRRPQRGGAREDRRAATPCASTSTIDGSSSRPTPPTA